MESPEFSLELLWAAGAALTVLGLLIGWLIGRRTGTAAQKYRQVERKLDQVLQDKKAYEDDVVEHFTETATLLNTLTGSYRDVHNHLSKGAGDLCQGNGPVSLGHLQDGRDPEEIPAQLADIQPPLDYAPKNSPDEKGMLNEEFGFERKPQDPANPKAE